MITIGMLQLYEKPKCEKEMPLSDYRNLTPIYFSKSTPDVEARTGW